MAPPTDPAAPSPDRRWRWLALAGDLAVFALAVACVAQTDGGRPFTFEHDIYHRRGEACLRTGDCPLTGSVLQGPGYVYLLALCRLFTANPSADYWLSLGLLGVAAVLAARLIHRAYGRPWGYLAVALLCADADLLYAYRDGEHAPFITAPLAALVWAGVQWVNGRGGRYLAVATAAAAVALHFHGIAWLALPGAFVAALAYRPPTPPRWVAAAAAAPLLIQATTIYDALRTRALPGSLHSTSAIHHFLLAQRGSMTVFALSVPAASIGLSALVLAVAALGPPRLRLQPRTAGTLLLFFAGPYAAFVATRASYLWLHRYLLVFQPALALLVAAALGTLAGWALRASPRRPLAALLWASLAAFAGWTLVATLRQADAARPQLATQGAKLTYRQQVDVARSLTARGVPPARWLGTVHGEPWWSEGIGPEAIGKAFGDPSRDAPGRQQLLIVDRCARLTPGFASWQRPLTGPEGRLLAGYEPRLDPVELRVSFPDGSAWSSPRFSRLLPGLCGFPTETLTRVAPPGSAPTRARFEDLWMNVLAGTLRLRAVLRPGAGDRVVAVQHGGRCHPVVRLGGAARAPLPDPSTADGSHFTPTGAVIDRYLVPAAEHAAGPVDLELTLDRAPTDEPDSAGQLRFLELDVFEEPWPACAATR